MDESNPDWAPSLHLGHGKEMNGNASSSRHTRKRRRAERSGSLLKQLHANALEGRSAVADSPVTSEDDEPLFDDHPDIQEAPDQECTDGGKADFSHVTDLTMEQIEHLEERESAPALRVLKEGMARTNRNSLTLFQEMLIFLIRLRLNVPLQDLAYRFNVSQSTVSRVVNKWIDVAFVRLSRAVKWPEPEELQ
nr:uncharacterized protein LOC126516758 [Dermacentor andersoni]